MDTIEYDESVWQYRVRLLLDINTTNEITKWCHQNIGVRHTNKSTMSRWGRIRPDYGRLPSFGGKYYNTFFFKDEGDAVHFATRWGAA